MLIKQVVAVMLISSLVCNAVGKTCSVKRVKSDSLKQARSLIKQYDNAKDVDDRACKEKKMSDLLNKLMIESDDFGGAIEAEAMGGELIASNVNLDEKVVLDSSIKLLQDKLATIDAQKPSAQKRRASQVEQESKRENKRRRSTN